MKTTPNTQVNNVNNDMLQLWAIFNQPGLYQAIPNQMSYQVQTMVQAPSQQQHGYMNTPRQYNIYSAPVPTVNMGNYY